MFTSWIITGIQIKSTMNYHYTSVKIPKTKVVIMLNISEDVEKLGVSYTVGEYVKWWVTVENRQVLIKPNMFITWPNSCTCGHLSQRNKNLNLYKNPYTNIYVILFVVANTWKQLKCSTGEWLSKLCICIMQYYSALKINKPLIYVVTWIDLKCIMFI